MIDRFNGLGQFDPDLDLEVRGFVEGYGRVVRFGCCRPEDLPLPRSDRLIQGHQSIRQIQVAIEDLSLFRDRLAGPRGLPFPRVYAAGNTLSFNHRGIAYRIDNRLV